MIKKLPGPQSHVLMEWKNHSATATGAKKHPLEKRQPFHKWSEKKDIHLWKTETRCLSLILCRNNSK
jgi:hypothetical protein